MDNKIATKKENSTDNLEKRKEGYSIRITTTHKDLIRNNKDIKEDLDKYVISYLKSFF